MAGTDKGTDRSIGDAQGRDTGPGGRSQQPALDAAADQILRDAREAELARLATPEIGTTTDPADDEPRRAEP
jgi:hypothetical protein